MDGIGACDTTRLTDKQRQQVAQIARNVQRCLDGTGMCDQSQLTEDQKQQVEEANRYNNLENCLEGMGDCTRSQFGSEEQQEVPEKRTTGIFASASTVRMPAIPPSLAAPNSATSS